MQIKVRVEGDTEVMRSLERAPLEIKKRAQQVIRAASFALERRIKKEMPVDTGRARSNWGHWTPAAKFGSIPANDNDSVWEEADGGLTIAQGTNLEYVQNLNEGSSSQAPRGFIDKAADAAQRALLRAVSKLIDEAME